MGLTDFSFTPSEYIFLNGEKFSPESEGNDSLALLCSDKMVNGYRLAIQMILAALLANEAEGALEIKVQEKKTLFGGSSKKDIFLFPKPPAPNWSGYTLESAIMFVIGNLFAAQEHSIYTTAYVLLAEKRPDPWQKIIERVEWGLASSNWLIPVQGEAASAFSTPFICPGRVRELAIEQPAEPIVSLLSGLHNGRPEVWQVMVADIERAMKDRKSK